MYWFRRPPYLKYAAVVLLLGFGVFAELRPEPTTMHLFAAADIAVGSVLSEDLFEARPVPRSLFEPVQPVGRAAHDLPRGEPLTVGSIDSQQVRVPEGWWSLEMPLPSPARAGMPVRLVIRPTNIDDAPTVVPGIVIDAPEHDSDPLGFGSPNGMIAIPEREAAATAVAVTDRRVTVLLSP